VDISPKKRKMLGSLKKQKNLLKKEINRKIQDLSPGCSGLNFYFTLLSRVL
jgi:hypothetical protein